jgi:hypothetical protein
MVNKHHGDHQKIDEDRGSAAGTVRCRKSWGRGMLAMPLGPKENSFQFSSTRRMISPKAQGDDGQVVAPQAQHRKAQDDAEKGPQAGADGQRHPEAEPKW